MQRTIGRRLGKNLFAGGPKSRFQIESFYSRFGGRKRNPANKTPGSFFGAATTGLSGRDSL